MGWLETLVVVVHVVIAVALVGLVLIQQGKGADAGAAFGGGASQTVFGSQGSGSFLTRLTTSLAIVFFVTSFSLAVFAKQRAEVAADAGIPVVQESVKVEEQAPAEPADKADAAAGEAESGKADLPELE
ncbi:preprotein translocase subunit SecG [Marinobacter lutaoensis]|jgi:preprotein translocase subunit SecG|uniref:Protein-export membrane protein SecG n=1 Tax=Marinobacter lutaoensis TaxID=135739 RepID=A0A1V2DR89_9GAMM|nr:preprotein translocase subunit SecG [Marinobacter lutaoensis]NVD34741.1 preprotein translocase subunit SecG [Marinobacter lutaoensis]ONF43234.1 preprotein translocase subunit SecG [Marinobacter lutaoensis]